MNIEELTENIILILNHGFKQLNAAPGNLLYFNFAGFPLKENVENFIAFDVLYGDVKLLIEVDKNKISVFERYRTSGISITELSREIEQFFQDSKKIQQILKQIGE